MERRARHLAFSLSELSFPFRCTLLAKALSLTAQSTHVWYHKLYPHYAHRALQSWSIKTGDVVDNASSDFLDVFKIVQSFSPGRITSVKLIRRLSF
jgi:hypothetical protein